MRWKPFGVMAILIALGAGCGISPSAKPGLPILATPPVSAFTEAGVVNAPVDESVAAVYGCATASSVVTVSIDQWPAIDALKSVQRVDVYVVDGVTAATWQFQDGDPQQLGLATYTREQSAGDVANVSAGQCFTVLVYAHGFTAGVGIVRFTADW
jgi:hypothetical protein